MAIVVIDRYGNRKVMMLTTSVGISATTFASANSKISGLSVSCAANAVYQIEGLLIFNMSVANTYKFALSNTNTTFKHAAGIWDGAISIAANQVSNNSTIQRGAWNQGSFGSVMLSAVAATTGTLLAKVDGIIATSTTGGIIQVKALASATTSPINILQGSMIKAFKIA